MKFGFDLDGTLDRPEIAFLANLLHDRGMEVHVITTCRLGSSGYEQTRDEKIAKLRKLGVRYSHLHLVSGGNMSEVGMDKARVINEEKIGMMIDDSSTFCTMMETNTTAAILRVRPPNERSTATAPTAA